MNKKGSIFLSTTLGIFIFIMGVLFLPFITDDIDQARIDLDCANSDGITSGTMLTCLQFSILTPYFIWFFVSVLLGFLIGGRL